MKKYIIASFVLAAVLSGCEHNLEHNMVPDKLGFSSTQALHEPSLLAEKATISIIKSGKGNSAADVRMEACTQEELDQWCTDTGYETGSENKLQIALSTSFKLEENSFHFDAEDLRKTTTVSWDSEFFANTAMGGKNYVIAFKLVDATIDTDELRSIVIIKPLLSRVTFKSKDLKTIFPTDKDTETINDFEGEINLDNAVPSQDITISLGVDNSLIAAEAEKRGKEFEEAPEGLLKAIDKTASVAAGQTIAHFNFTLDYSALFNGNGEFIKRPVNYMIPVTITGTDPKLIGEGNIPVSCIVVSVADDGTIIPPSTPMELIHGPWEVLEGMDQHIGKDPKCTAPDWYGHYNPTKLVDWSCFTNNNDASKNGFWGSYFWTEPTFPMVFVFDTAETYIFGEWYKIDYSTFQGQFREFEIYVSQEYHGADTNWKLAAKGRTDKRETPAYGDGTNADVIKQFTYIIPADYEAEGSEFNYTQGRYIKLVITKGEGVSGQNSGYLAEFFAKGWKQ